MYVETIRVPDSNCDSSSVNVSPKRYRPAFVFSGIPPKGNYGFLPQGLQERDPGEAEATCKRHMALGRHVKLHEGGFDLSVSASPPKRDPPTRPMVCRPLHGLLPGARYSSVC